MWVAFFAAIPVFAGQAVVTGPDNRLQATVSVKEGIPVYSVTYCGKSVLTDSPLGFVADVGDFSREMVFTGQRTSQVKKTYTQDRIKQSCICYEANELTCTFANVAGQTMDVVFRVSNHDIAFRYELPRYGDTGSLVVEKETTGFGFPSYTTTFLCPQSDAMTGWKRTKPSYEEEYEADAPLGKPSAYGNGFTFPCLFRVGEDAWVLVSETGVDSRYCASHLGDAADGIYPVTFPLPEENNGNGTSSPGFALPGVTPWRTITVGRDLAPIVETTVPWDVVEPLYETAHTYRPGRSTWSWILWQDESINPDDQRQYIDLAATMGYEYVLVDNWWNTRIGRENMESLVDYARGKGVNVFLWYSSGGYWNDIVQGPVNCMDNPIVRKREMKWLRQIGVKGIKVDFFGGDKQETLRLYEAVLSDADDYGLMVIFHGCTLPRGWERMYPNYMGSEAVLASENLVFQQHFCDREAFNACLHPFIRNAVGSMEFGGVFLNKHLNRGNDGGTVRRTTDVFQLATGVLFQNPVQNFALAPNNLTDAPSVCLDFMKGLPTTWDETRWLAGYPGQYVVLARRHGDTWYVAGINARAEPLALSVDLALLGTGKALLYRDDRSLAPVVEEIRLQAPQKTSLTLPSNGGFVLVK